jgi:hypothetical protein
MAKYTPEQVLAAVNALAADGRWPQLSVPTGDIARKVREMNGDDPHRNGNGDVTPALNALVGSGELVSYLYRSRYDMRGTSRENPAYAHIAGRSYGHGSNTRWWATPANADLIKQQREAAGQARIAAQDAADELAQTLRRDATDEAAWQVERRGDDVRLTMTVEQAQWLTALLKRGN